MCRPPVSLNTSQLSTVPTHRSPPASLQRRHMLHRPGDLGRAEIGIEQQARSSPAAPARALRSFSAAQRSAVRRSCQTIAGPSASPVRRDQKTMVSRWLVMPIAGDPARAARLLDHRPRAGQALLPDLLGIVLDPARLRIMLGQFALLAAQARAVRGEQHRPRARRARIDDEDKFAGHPPPVTPAKLPRYECPPGHS